MMIFSLEKLTLRIKRWKHHILKILKFPILFSNEPIWRSPMQNIQKYTRNTTLIYSKKKLWILLKLLGRYAIQHVMCLAWDCLANINIETACHIYNSRETLSRSNKRSINARVLLSPFPDCSWSLRQGENRWHQRVCHWFSDWNWSRSWKSYHFVF